MKKPDNSIQPAVVKYIGLDTEQFTYGNEYEAFFLEYWQGKRDSLHVRGNNGEITDFNPFEDFEVISDEGNLLNDYEAILRCITRRYDNKILALTFGKEYKAIGRDKDGLYLVMDDSCDCYFYPPEFFEVVADEHGILSYKSVYYSYRN